MSAVPTPSPAFGARTPLPEQGEQSGHESRVSASRRRDKPQLSCNMCRRRKLRCDRQHPCQTCSLRGHVCTYPANSSVKPAATANAMRDRLEQLERLVKTLASEPNNNQAPARPNATLMASPGAASPAGVHGSAPSESGSAHGSNSELFYIGDGHWATILNSLADLKDHFDAREPHTLAPTPDHSHSDASPDQGAAMPRLDGHSLLLYGSVSKASQAELVAGLPPRSTLDRHVSRYFNSHDLISPSLHGPTFLQEYEAFWADSSSMPPIWLGLVYGIMCLSLMVSGADSSAQGIDAEQQAIYINLYREKIVQSLVLGEYTNAGPYVLETMLHYLYIEFAIRPDADKDLWFLLALEVNLALRMGFHRDPSQFPGISPLRCEMRRRIWAIVLQSDILISSQMGMPRMIADWQCDTAEPRNYADTDLDPNSSTLPPPRPQTDMTCTLGLIARRRALTAVAAVADLTAKPKSPSHAEVMQVDKQLHDAVASIPPPFQMKSMTASIMDSAQVIMSRLWINHLFYKAQMNLYGRFVLSQAPQSHDAWFHHSHKACLDAALGMLHIQHVFDQETCPGGQLQTMRWRVSSIVKHQFLTATMLLCLILHRNQANEQQNEVVAALRTAQTIWSQSSYKSAEARKAADAIDFVLARTSEGSASRGPNVQQATSPRPSEWSQSAPERTDRGAPDMSLGDQASLPAAMDFFDSEHFGMAGLLGDLGYADALPPNFGLDGNPIQRGAEADEWSAMDTYMMRW